MATELQQAVGRLGLEDLDWFVEQIAKQSLIPSRFSVDMPPADNVLATVDFRFDLGEQVTVRFVADTNRAGVDFLIMRSSDQEQEGIVPDPDRDDYEECLGRLMAFKQLRDLGADPNTLNC